MFKVADVVVYPGHGVAVVEEVQAREVDGKSHLFFRLKFKFKNFTVLVPERKLGESRIRRISGPEQVSKMLSDLNNLPLKELKKNPTYPIVWNKRQRDYQIRLESGTLQEVANIYRELRISANQKELSFGERNLMLNAEQLLMQEVISVTSTSEAEVLNRLRSPFLCAAL